MIQNCRSSFSALALACACGGVPGIVAMHSELAMARWGMPSSQKIQLNVAKKRAGKLEAKGKAVDFKELLRMTCHSFVSQVSAWLKSH
jgi:hypothetical protein